MSTLTAQSCYEVRKYVRSGLRWPVQICSDHSISSFGEYQSPGAMYTNGQLYACNTVSHVRLIAPDSNEFGILYGSAELYAENQNTTRITQLQTSITKGLSCSPLNKVDRCKART